MSRGHRVRLLAGRALYDKALEAASEAFRDLRYRDALGVYERFLSEHPGIHTEEIEHRIRVLKEYIEEHIEESPGTTDSSKAAQESVVVKHVERSTE